MSGEWDTSYHDIGIQLKERIVLVRNDEALKLLTDRRAFYDLAAYILAEYKTRFDTSIGISARSLACEIYWHYYIKEKSEAIERKFGKKRLTTWLLKHMEIIDCGDRKADNNRFLWDLLAIFFPGKKNKG